MDDCDAMDSCLDLCGKLMVVDDGLDKNWMLVSLHNHPWDWSNNLLRMIITYRQTMMSVKIVLESYILG